MGFYKILIIAWFYLSPTPLYRKCIHIPPLLHFYIASEPLQVHAISHIARVEVASRRCS